MNKNEKIIAGGVGALLIAMIGIMTFTKFRNVASTSSSSGSSSSGSSSSTNAPIYTYTLSVSSTSLVLNSVITFNVSGAPNMSWYLKDTYNDSALTVPHLTDSNGNGSLNMTLSSNTPIMTSLFNKQIAIAAVFGNGSQSNIVTLNEVAAAASTMPVGEPSSTSTSTSASSGSASTSAIKISASPNPFNVSQGAKLTISISGLMPSSNGYVASGSGIGIGNFTSDSSGNATVVATYEFNQTAVSGLGNAIANMNGSTLTLLVHSYANGKEATTTIQVIK